MVYLKRTKAILQVVNFKITEEFFSIWSSSINSQFVSLRRSTAIPGSELFLHSPAISHSQNKNRRNHTQQWRSVHYRQCSDTAHNTAWAIVRGKANKGNVKHFHCHSLTGHDFFQSLTSPQKYKEPLAFHYLCSITWSESHWFCTYS